MTKRIKPSTLLDMNRAHSLELADGRKLEQGQEFTVAGGGRYSMAYQFLTDGSVAAYGPIGAKSQQWRSFAPEQIRTIHTKVMKR